MSRPLQIGDLCITVNTKHPACNDGALVTIVNIDHTQRDRDGSPLPYLIRRIDGQPHLSTTDRKTGAPQWAKCYEAWCVGYKLKRIDPDELAETSVIKLEVTA